MIRFIKVLFLILISSNHLHSQQLNVSETITYINDKLSSSHKFIITEGGEIFLNQFDDDFASNIASVFDRKDCMKVFNENNSEFVKYLERKYTFNSNDISVKNLGYRNGDFFIEIYCSKNDYSIYKWESNCKIKNDYGNDRTSKSINSFKIKSDKKDENDKIYNALEYLLLICSKNSRFEKNDSDPFANSNFKKLRSFVTGEVIEDNIKLIKNNGTYSIDVFICDSLKRFVLDSGASELLISKKLENELIARNIISKESYLTSGLYKIADGSIIKNRRLIIPKLKVGKFTVVNISASVSNNDSPLLLGKNFLDQFEKWTINNTTNELKLQK